MGPVCDAVSFASTFTEGACGNQECLSVIFDRWQIDGASAGGTVVRHDHVGNRRDADPILASARTDDEGRDLASRFLMPDFHLAARQPFGRPAPRTKMEACATLTYYPKAHDNAIAWRSVMVLNERACAMPSAILADLLRALRHVDTGPSHGMPTYESGLRFFGGTARTRGARIGLSADRAANTAWRKTTVATDVHPVACSSWSRDARSPSMVYCATWSRIFSRSASVRSLTDFFRIGDAAKFRRS